MNFFQSKLGGPTDGQAMGKKNKLWEAGVIKKGEKSERSRPYNAGLTPGTLELHGTLRTQRLQ